MVVFLVEELGGINYFGEIEFYLAVLLSSIY